MAHKNREKRAAKKAREAEKDKLLNKARYDDDEDDDYYDDDYEDERPKRRRGLHPALTALIVTVAILACGYYGLTKYYASALEPVSPGDTRDVLVIISEGSSTTAIAKTLRDRNLIKSEYVFRIHCQRMEYDGKFKYGEYTLNRNMSVDDIVEVLIKGVALASTKKFTIPEGYNITQIARVLAEQGIVSQTDFYEVIRDGVFDYAFLADCPPGDERLEGFLYPETYEIYTDATAHDVVSKMLAQFDALFKDEYYARAEELGLSVRDIVTMGSIVERESVKPEERPVMARVFYNRLEEGMKLESCATIQYILGEPKEYLTNADTQIESPYNTYLHEGLPPGPICNPRIASVEAALFPDDNDYLFFVLSDALDGSHKFSRDYNEFLKNKEAYYKAVEGR